MNCVNAMPERLQCLLRPGSRGIGGVSSPVRGTLQLHDGEKLSTLTTVTVAHDSFTFASNPPD
jgi:hypothetical protein